MRTSGRRWRRNTWRKKTDCKWPPRPLFWLEEERVLSEDWVVRYKNRLLQLARQNRHWAPAQSRVRVRENEPGHIVIHYRGQSLPPLHRLETILNNQCCRTMIFQRTATTPLIPCLSPRVHSTAPSPAPPSPKLKPRLAPASHHPWRQGWQQMKTPAFSWAW